MKYLRLLLRDRSIWIQHPHVALVLVQASVGFTQLGMSVAVARYWGAAERADLAVVVTVGTLGSTLASRGLPDILVRVTDQSRFRPLVRFGCGRIIAAALLSGGIVQLIVGAPMPAVAAAVVAVGVYFSRTISSALFGRGNHFAADVTQSLGFVLSFGVALTTGLLGSKLSAAWLVPLSAWLPMALAGALLVAGAEGRGPTSLERRLGNASLAGAFSSQALLRGDLVWASVLVSKTELGVYSVAAGMAEAVATTVGSVGSFALRGKETGVRFVRFAIVSSIVGGAMIVTVSYVMAALLLPAEFSRLPIATAILAPGAVAMAVARVQYGVLLRQGGTVANVVVAYGAAIVLMVGLDYGFRSHGVLGLSAASAISYLVCLAGVWLMLRLIDHDADSRR